MSTASLVQYGAVPVDRHAPRPAGGCLPRSGLRGRADLARSGHGTPRASHLQARRDRPQGGDGLEALCGVLRGLRPRRDVAPVRGATPATDTASVRSRLSAGAPGPGSRDEHGDQLRDHDDVAGVRRRDDDDLREPGLRPHVAELPGRGGRSRRRHRVHPGPRTPAHATARELLGGRDARDAVGPAASSPSWAPSCWCGRGSP